MDKVEAKDNLKEFWDKVTDLDGEGKHTFHEQAVQDVAGKDTIGFAQKFFVAKRSESKFAEVFHCLCWCACACADACSCLCVCICVFVSVHIHSCESMYLLVSMIERANV